MAFPLILFIKVKRKFEHDVVIEGSVRYFLHPELVNTLQIGSSEQATIWLPDAAEEHLVLHVKGAALFLELEHEIKVSYNKITKNLAAGKQVKFGIPALQSAPLILQVGSSRLELHFIADTDILSGTRLEFLQQKHGPLHKIGQGGISLVYKTEDAEEPLALKVLSIVRDKEIVSRFISSGEISKRFVCPAIIPAIETYAYPEHDLYYTTMSYFPGETLQNLIGRLGPLDLKRTTYIIKNIAEGISFLHRDGHLHRDLSHRNVLVAQNGAVRLIGLSLMKVPDFALTSPGTVIASPNFTAPEQISQLREIDVRADVFSLGAILYTMLCGQPPFGARTFREYRKLVAKLPQPHFPKHIRTQLPEALIGLIRRTLSAKAHKRAASIAEWLELFMATAGSRRRVAQHPLELSASTICSRWDVLYGDYQLATIDFDSSGSEQEPEVYLSKHFLDANTLQIRGSLNSVDAGKGQLSMAVYRGEELLHSPVSIPDPRQVDICFQEVPIGPCTLVIKSQDQEVWREECQTACEIQKAFLYPDGDLLVSGRLTVVCEAPLTLRVLDAQGRKITESSLSYSEDLYKIFRGGTFPTYMGAPAQVQVLLKGEELASCAVVRVVLDPLRWQSHKYLSVAGRVWGVVDEEQLDILVNNVLKDTVTVNAQGRFATQIETSDRSIRYKVAVRYRGELVAKAFLQPQPTRAERWGPWLPFVQAAGVFLLVILSAGMLVQGWSYWRCSHSSKPVVIKPTADKPTTDSSAVAAPVRPVEHSNQVPLHLEPPRYLNLRERRLLISGTASGPSVELTVQARGRCVKQDYIPVAQGHFSWQITVPSWQEYKITVSLEGQEVSAKVPVPAKVRQNWKLLAHLKMVLPQQTQAFENSVQQLLQDRNLDKFVEREAQWRKNFNLWQHRFPSENLVGAPIFQPLQQAWQQLQVLHTAVHRYLLFGEWLAIPSIKSVADVIKARRSSQQALLALCKSYTAAGGRPEELFRFLRR